MTQQTYPIKCRISNSADGPTRVDVFDDIGEGGFFGGGLSAKGFAAQLKDVKGALEVHINSGGGDVFDGISIGNAIRSHKGPVKTVVDGLAASIASVIAQAGQERILQPGSMLMIHDAFGMTVGNAAEMAKMAQTLDQVSDNLAEIYASRAGGTQESWRDAMKAETWYTAEEAVAAGLADRVGEDDAVLPAGFDLAAFSVVPGRIAARLRQMPQAPADTRPDAEDSASPDIRGETPGACCAACGPGCACTATPAASAGSRPLAADMHGDHVRVDPDGDGDCDACPEGDTDHDYWDEDGNQIKPLPDSAAALTAAQIRAIIREEISDAGRYWAAKYKQADRDRMAKSGEAMEDGCVSGETLVATRQGARRIDSLIGPQELLTDAGWAQAEVRSFGVKPLLAVTLANGDRRETVHASAGHRWLLAGGEWKRTTALAVGDRIPHVQVLGEGVQADDLDAADGRVAGDAQQAPDAASSVIMVNLEASPRAASGCAGTVHLRNSPADRASAALLDGKGLELGVGNSVLALEVALSLPEPPLIAASNERRAFLGALSLAEHAVGTAVLPRRPDVEVGVCALDPADSADDQSFVLDGDASRVRIGILGPELREPVGEIVPAAETFGVVRLSAIGNAANSHTSNLTRFGTWRVEEVAETQRVEEVFCAVVPDLHRFTLASGILTGNSYPIADEEDLDNAIRAVGRGGADHDSIREHIIKRAKALGLSERIPDNWNADGSLKDSFNHAPTDLSGIDLEQIRAALKGAAA